MKIKLKVSQVMFKHTTAMAKVSREKGVAYINIIVIERNRKRIQCRL